MGERKNPEVISKSSQHLALFAYRFAHSTTLRKILVYGLFGEYCISQHVFLQKHLNFVMFFVNFMKGLTDLHIKSDPSR